ncbi:ssDNA endodeoxyribonuclease, variant 2 [Homalodisca vitripennis]|nr:ssDNA endodeoxyribonuclease, variant 2 [Homalodisca vitripennis]
MYRTNQNIRWLCKTSGVVFLDLDKYITNRYLARDGIHLNRRGTTMLDRVLAHVASLCDKIYPNVVNKHNFSSQNAQVEVLNQYNELKSSYSGQSNQKHYQTDETKDLAKTNIVNSKDFPPELLSFKEFPPLPSTSDDTTIPNSVILQPVEESYVSDTSSSVHTSQGHQFYTDPTMHECQVKCQKVNGSDMISLPPSCPVSVIDKLIVPNIKPQKISQVQQNFNYNTKKTFSFKPVTEKEVEKIVLSFDNKYSAGVDEIPRTLYWVAQKGWLDLNCVVPVEGEEGGPLPSAITPSLPRDGAVDGRASNNESFITVQRLFRQRFGVARDEPIPDRRSISRWVTAFRTTGSVMSGKSTGRPRTAVTPQNIENEFHVADEQVAFKIDLTVLLDCLSIFDNCSVVPGATAALKMFCTHEGAPLKLLRRRCDYGLLAEDIGGRRCPGFRLSSEQCRQQSDLAIWGLQGHLQRVRQHVRVCRATAVTRRTFLPDLHGGCCWRMSGPYTSHKRNG